MPIVLKSGSLNLLEPSGPHRDCYGTALAFFYLYLPGCLTCYISHSCTHRARPFVPCGRMFHKTLRRVCIVRHSPLERFVAGHVCVETQTRWSRHAPCALRRDSSERCLLSSASGHRQQRRRCSKATTG